MNVSLLWTAWAQLLSVALGLWMMSAPAILGYGTPAADIGRIIGPVAASFALVAVAGATRPLRWANVPLGLFLAASPLALDYSTAATVNSVGVGLLLAVLAFFKGHVAARYGGGWSTLLPGHRVPDA